MRSLGLPATDCPACGAWVPCRLPVLVVDPRGLTGPAGERWVSVDTPADALALHLARDCAPAWEAAA